MCSNIFCSAEEEDKREVSIFTPMDTISHTGCGTLFFFNLPKAEDSVQLAGLLDGLHRGTREERECIACCFEEMSWRPYVGAHCVRPELKVLDLKTRRKGLVGGGEQEDGVRRDGEAAIRGLEDTLVDGAAHLAVHVGRHLTRPSPAAAHRDHDPASSRTAHWL
jgi:hypothetical protein